MADIAKNAVYVPSFRFWQTFQDWRSHHTVSVQISSPQYSVCKNAFSASETTILPMWLYILLTPVYLMSLWCAYMKLRRISNFHFKRLYLASICVYYSFRDDFECYGKMADIAKNAVYVLSFRVWQTFQDWRSYHTVLLQISPPQYSMCKNVFSASETTI